MTHKVLIRLEEDIQAQADKNLELAEKTGKPLIAPNAIMAYELMMNNLLREPVQSIEQVQGLENEPVNFRKDN